jgi:hypothetical protein
MPMAACTTQLVRHACVAQATGPFEAGPCGCTSWFSELTECCALASLQEFVQRLPHHTPTHKQTKSHHGAPPHALQFEEDLSHGLLSTSLAHNALGPHNCMRYTLLAGSLSTACFLWRCSSLILLAHMIRARLVSNPATSSSPVAANSVLLPILSCVCTEPLLATRVPCWHASYPACSRICCCPVWATCLQIHQSQNACASRLAWTGAMHVEVSIIHKR